MGTLTKPYTFTGGQYAIASQVNADLDTLYNWANGGGAMWSDGSVAFTATPSGPNADPTTANQLTRKSYVDSAVTTLTNSVATKLGMSASAGHSIRWANGGATSDASGNFSVTFGTPFTSICEAVIATYAQGSPGYYLLTFNPTRTGFSARLIAGGGTAQPNTNLNYMYIACGF